MNKDNRKVISFDFDDTIAFWNESTDASILNEKIYKAMERHKKEGHKVIVVTTRYEMMWKYETLDDLRRWDILGPLVEEQSDVHFTDHEWKKDTLLKLGVSRHYDDNKYELALLKETEIEGIWVHDVE